MFVTNDEDIRYFLEDEQVRELLSTLSESIGYVTVEFLSNILIYLFYSLETEKNDWVMDVINMIDEKRFTTKQLAPSLCMCDEDLEAIFNNIRIKAETLIKRGSLDYGDTKIITYEKFNEYMSILYEMCLEKYQWV